jgi:hypothetical protein
VSIQGLLVITPTTARYIKMMMRISKSEHSGVVGDNANNGEVCDNANNGSKFYK